MAGWEDQRNVPISVLAVARRIGIVSGWQLPHLSMQKLAYVANMFWLGKHSGRPLVSGNFEARPIGPIHPVLYYRARIFGSRPVRDIFDFMPPMSDEMADKIGLDDLIRKWGPDEERLSAFTEWEQGAWAAHQRSDGTKRPIIPNAAVVAEYQRRTRRALQRSITGTSGQLLHLERVRSGDGEA